MSHISYKILKNVTEFYPPFQESVVGISELGQVHGVVGKLSGLGLSTELARRWQLIQQRP